LRLPGEKRRTEYRRCRPRYTLQIPKRGDKGWPTFGLSGATDAFGATHLAWKIRKTSLVENGRRLHLIPARGKSGQYWNDLTGKDRHARNDAGGGDRCLILRKGR
jgi:hypothetical protein